MRDEELDRMIDAGLSTYAEPRAGLEQRVLAAVDAEREQRVLAAQSPRWRMWAMGLATAACLLIAITVALRIGEAPQPAGRQANNGAHTPAMHRAIAPEARTQAPVRIAAKRRVRRSDEASLRRLPKKQLFPTPQPLSPEMQALVQYVANAPEKERKQFAQAQAQLDAPITIAPLRIAPLEIADKDGD